MPPPDPEWTVQAHLSGLPYTNWKKRTGYDMRGSLAECAERFLNLPYHHQINCSLSWEGGGHFSSSDDIRSLLRRIGPPPQMAARMMTAERWLQMMAKPKAEFRPDTGPYNDASTIGLGPRDG